MIKHGKKLLCASILCGLGLAGAAHAQNDTAAAAPQDSKTPASSDKSNKTPQQRAQDKQAQNLQQVTVTGYRESLAKAIEIKRNANAIVDAINAEDIGKFPDTNAAESLSHLPGISVDRQFGEGEKVSINGTDPALNRVLINGQTIASGDWGGNPTDTSGRTFNYTLLSPEIIGNMQVYKSPEAHIDEGSIGGTVIVNTRKPLDLPANTLRGSLGYSYNDRSEEGNPRGSVLWSWKNSDSTFGFLTAVTHDKENLSRAGIEFFGYSTPGTSIPSTATVHGSGDVATAKYPVGINSSYFQQVRKRDGIQSALQWRPDEKNEFNLTGIYVRGSYNNFSESRYVCPGCGDTNKITDLTVNNGYITNATVSANTGNGQPYAELDANYRMSKVTTKSLNLRHDYNGDKWILTSQVGYTAARGGKDPEYLMKYLLNSGGYNFSYDGRNTSVNYDNGSASNWGLPASPAGSPPGDSTLNGKYQAGGIYYETTKDRERYAQFDASRDLEWGPIYQVQMGFKYINHVNSQFSQGNRINTTDAISLTDFEPGTTPGNLYDGLHAGGDLTDWPTANLGAVKSYLNGQPQGPYNLNYPSIYNVREMTRDLYTQFNYNAGGFRGNFGVRYVDTTDKSTYYQSNNGGAYYLTQGKTHYYKPLPSFNIAYDIDDSKVARFGVSKVIARPRYSDLAGSVSLNCTGGSTGNCTGSAGNPNLKPYSSTNYDLAGEWYFAPSSMLGAEVFYRKIGNYIVSTTDERTFLDPTTGQTNLYTITSPVNVSNAKVRGISLLYQQDLGHGFGVQTNYTYAHADTSTGLNLPYLSKNTFNIIPYFEKGPWSARVNYSWRSPYFTQIGRLDSHVFADQYKELDFSASYQVNQWMSVTFSATNLLDSTYYWYNDVKYAPIGEYKNGRTFAVGVNFKL
ncbi:TonB-dependent receptor [Dyella marensis]|jgi:iron complex outermembrane receptor protein|uniref:Iron complex outermembrane recepter protein n=1 Tax=Dyella marensis TaxID=500610 RepID=A0A1I1XIL5_9GAMM|nr:MULTISPECIES: TonB-dependent receptor [Dyella]SFE07031.1 iron complex outermembrane recepter protein [Dyella marensis]